MMSKKCKRLWRNSKGPAFRGKNIQEDLKALYFLDKLINCFGIKIKASWRSDQIVGNIIIKG